MVVNKAVLLLVRTLMAPRLPVTAGAGPIVKWKTTGTLPATLLPTLLPWPADAAIPLLITWKGLPVLSLATLVKVKLLLNLMFPIVGTENSVRDSEFLTALN